MSTTSWRVLRRATLALTDHIQHYRQSSTRSLQSRLRCCCSSSAHSDHRCGYDDDQQSSRVQRNSSWWLSSPFQGQGGLRAFSALTRSAVVAVDSSLAAARQEEDEAPPESTATHNVVSESLYYLDVATGDLRGAGSKLSIYVQIHGESSSSKPIRLTRHSETLTRGSLRHFEVQSSRTKRCRRLMNRADRSFEP